MARRIFSISIILGFLLLAAVLMANSRVYALTPTISATPSRTATTCSPVVVVTSTPSPTMTATPRIATATTTPTCGIRYITATPSVSPTPWDGPDLFVNSASITYAGSSPACANSPKDNIVVSNIGTVDAGPFVVLINGAPTNVNGLAAGQSITLVVPAMSSIDVVVDSTHVVTETNENNNFGSANLPIPTQAPTCTPTATASMSKTPTRTPTGACFMTAVPIRVSPVTSPTNALTQVITVTLSSVGSVTVTSEAGSFTSSTPTGNVYSVTINLVPNSTNHLQVQGTVIPGGSCATYTLSTTVDISGNPLTIVQGTGVVTNTPTRTPTPTLTPTLGTGTCSPVDAVIAAPFTKDGAGTFCWQSSNLGAFINSWNLATLSINGVNVTNLYVASSAYPAKINGYWYVRYISTVAWGHFEAR